MNNPETEAAVEIDESRLDEISGGPIYMNYEGVKGSVTSAGASSPTGGINVALGDGSVRGVRD